MLLYPKHLITFYLNSGLFCNFAIHGNIKVYSAASPTDSSLSSHSVLKSEQVSTNPTQFWISEQEQAELRQWVERKIRGEVCVCGVGVVVVV